MLFLQPVNSESSEAEDYEYFSWQHFHPAKGSHDTTSLHTVYSAGIAPFPTNDFAEFTDPVGLNLGEAKKVINTGGSEPHFSSDTNKIGKDDVGVVNVCTDPDQFLSVIWYVNGDKVVATNNTDDSKLLPNDTSEFELKQTLYVTLAIYDSEKTYNIQTVARMFDFEFNNDDTDLYFEIDYKDGLVVNQIAPEAYEASFLLYTPMIQANKNDVVFSGHGAIDLGQGFTKVPEGVKLVVLAPPAASVSNELCQAVEYGSAINGLEIVSPETKEKSPTEPFIYEAGKECPNYLLFPINPGWLKPGIPHLITVNQKTALSDLWEKVTPYIKSDETITVYWCTCTALGGATNPVVIGA